MPFAIYSSLSDDEDGDAPDPPSPKSQEPKIEEVCRGANGINLAASSDIDEDTEDDDQSSSPSPVGSVGTVGVQEGAAETALGCLGSEREDNTAEKKGTDEQLFDPMAGGEVGPNNRALDSSHGDPGHTSNDEDKSDVANYSSNDMSMETAQTMDWEETK